MNGEEAKFYDYHGIKAKKFDKVTLKKDQYLIIGDNFKKVMMEDILARSTRSRFRESFDKKGKKNMYTMLLKNKNLDT